MKVCWVFLIYIYIYIYILLRDIVFLFEVDQWVDLHWKHVTGSGQNSRFVTGKLVIEIVVWTGWPTVEWKAPCATWREPESSHGNIQFCPATGERHTWKCPGWGKNWYSQLTHRGPQLSSQNEETKKENKKSKGKEPPKYILRYSRLYWY